MKKSIILVVCIMVATLFSTSTFCMYSSELYHGATQNALAYFLKDGTQVTRQEFEDAILQDCLNDPGCTGTVVVTGPNTKNSSSPTDSSISSASPSATVPSAGPAETVAKEKVNVWFTNSFGNVIGSSQVTKGTDIAASQFVQEVPDCDGKTFDHWDYDGRVIEHQFIIRAVYK